MATFNWNISTIERNTSDNGVIVAHWRCEGVDGDNSATNYGTVGFTPDPTSADFIAFEDLTEANVLDWVYAEVSKDDTEASLQAQLDEMANPTTAVGVPWSTI